MKNSSAYKYTALIKDKASSAGFDFCGISPAAFLEEEAPRLEKWLKEGKHGQMKYMENYFDKRLDPKLLVEGARSVISLLYNYYPSRTQENESPLISKYAYGEDYHHVIKEKLALIIEELRQQIGEFNYRIFVDSAPVMDKVWAKKSGLGWIGKHSNLLSRRGSYFFIAEIICDLELQYDGEIKDFCGTCTRCIDACPTGAITEPYVVDGSKCISYLTIELKEQIPSEFSGKMQNWAFGCDICQDVCPWNSFSTPTTEKLFAPKKELLLMSEKEWQEMSEETFKSLFKNSAVKRTKFAGLKRNLKFMREGF